MGSLEYFAFGMWQLWLDTNRFIFSLANTSLSECIYHTINLAREFHFLTAKNILKPPIIKIYQMEPFSSSLCNFKYEWKHSRQPGQSGGCKSFPINFGITSNNVAELWVVRHGLHMAWELGFRFICLEIDYTLVIHLPTSQSNPILGMSMTVFYVGTSRETMGC